MTATANLQRHDVIRMRYGKAGSQVAVVVKRTDKAVYVRKWRANSKRWTKNPSKLHPNQFLGHLGHGKEAMRQAGVGYEG